MPNISVIQGDALAELHDIPSETIDLIIADPPYNLGKDYGNDSDNQSFEDYLIFSSRWLCECDRILKKTGTIYIFMGFRYISYLYNILEKDLKYNFGNWITWHYTQGIGKTKGFSARHDDILMFHKSKNFTFNLDAIRVPQKYYRSRNNMRGANPGDVWSFSHIHYCNANRQNHPTQKPEGIIERMILASSNENDTILDPFAGSGTTLRVCQQLNRNVIGIEINSEYSDMIHNRLSKEFSGFDSIDPRMSRVPLDLRQLDIRQEYLLKHKEWFLKNHDNYLGEFHKAIIEVYGKQAVRELSDDVKIQDNDNLDFFKMV